MEKPKFFDYWQTILLLTMVINGLMYAHVDPAASYLRYFAGWTITYWCAQAMLFIMRYAIYDLTK